MKGIAALLQAMSHEFRMSDKLLRTLNKEDFAALSQEVMREKVRRSPVDSYEDVDVLEPLGFRADFYPDKWACQFPNGLIAYFPNEEDACAFQRTWRTLVGLDPMTGENL